MHNITINVWTYLVSVQFGSFLTSFNFNSGTYILQYISVLFKEGRYSW